MHIFPTDFANSRCHKQFQGRCNPCDWRAGEARFGMILNSCNFQNRTPQRGREADFQKCMNVKSCQKQLLRPSNRTDYTYFGTVYGTWNLQNRLEKCVFLVYVPSLEALFAPMCSTACILHEIYIFSPCFRHDFASKLTLLSEVTSHKYVRLPLPARYVVYMSPRYLHSGSIESTDSIESVKPLNPCRLAGIADFELHALFRHPESACRSEIEGRRCCPPQRAFNIITCEPTVAPSPLTL